MKIKPVFCGVLNELNRFPPVEAVDAVTPPLEPNSPPLLLANPLPLEKALKGLTAALAGCWAPRPVEAVKVGFFNIGPPKGDFCC